MMPTAELRRFSAAASMLMSQAPSSSLIAALSRSAGFALSGIAPVPAEDSPEGRAQRTRFEQWIASGAAGEMEYLKRRNDQGDLVRASLHSVFPWARSVIVCAADYSSAQPRSIDPAQSGTAWIARYAQTGSHVESETGSRPTDDAPSRPSDYHKVLLRRLQSLDAALKAKTGPFESRCYVDTGPLVERVYSRLAGIGWTGKNTCILNQRLGSWLFLGVILTSLEPESDTLPQLAADRCGTCTRCIDACPTQALTPYQMDATRCISYLTIEKRGPIPEELRPGIGRQVFGCDICQDVCPWNNKARTPSRQSDDPELAPRAALVNPALDWLAGMSEEDFGHWFFGSPVKRARFAGLRRNLAIAMGNSGLIRFLPRLKEWAASNDPVLRESAQWAIQRLDENHTD
ncbi:MAG TPA: tRNA epoxyqueuosine(34) reductase QueG [Acidobacteriaceae bacterium]|nr:tRNA epoxyqueuosine(34) reductase QueG [Acidobacteriaceae bacterium]